MINELREKYYQTQKALRKGIEEEEKRNISGKTNRVRKHQIQPLLVYKKGRRKGKQGNVQSNYRRRRGDN